MLRKCDLVREDTLVSTSEIRGSIWLHRKGEDWQTPLLVLCHKGPVVFTPSQTSFFSLDPEQMAVYKLKSELYSPNRDLNRALDSRHSS